MNTEENMKLWRWATSQGYNCPSPVQYPKRFNLYIKIHNLKLPTPSKINNNLAFVISTIVVFSTIWIIL